VTGEFERLLFFFRFVARPNGPPATHPLELKTAKIPRDAGLLCRGRAWFPCYVAVGDSWTTTTKRGGEEGRGQNHENGRGLTVSGPRGKRPLFDRPQGRYSFGVPPKIAVIGRRRTPGVLFGFSDIPRTGTIRRFIKCFRYTVGGTAGGLPNRALVIA